MTHAPYMYELFNPERQEHAIKDARKALRKLNYDGILVSGGVSGMFGAILAHRLKKRLVVARKAGVTTHSTYKVEGLKQGDKLVFVDDLIGSGETIKHCFDQVKKQATIMSAWLYNEGSLRDLAFLNRVYGIGRRR